jgi:amylosucrase
VAAASTSWNARPLELKVRDAQREADAGWFQSERMLGGVAYVDRFAGNLAGIRDQIPYFRELGLTYLHLMPLFDAPDGDNDGGYAVSSYRKVNPSLGTMEELTDLAADLRRPGSRSSSTSSSITRAMSTSGRRRPSRATPSTPTST